MRSRLISAAFVLWAMCAPLAAQQTRMLVQSSPLAGAQYYEADAQWHDMRVGDELALVREPDNEHDPNAVRVEWRGHKLGYLPRAENRAVAAELDRGTPLAARIAQLLTHRNPWRRVRVDIWVTL